MNRKFFFYTVLALCAGSQHATAGVEPSYNSHEPRAVTPWYGRAGEEQRKADLGFIKGMRPHHAGALTMSEEYLSNPKASNARLKALARGIIHNQEFEIGMLDDVEAYIDAAAKSNKSMQRIATKGLSQRDRFVRAPMPGPLDKLSGNQEVSVADVKFAKAMIVHHQGALDMAHEYISDPHADNGYLRRMCQDILVDQSQEIAFMNSIIGEYKGDPAKIALDPSMIHGMEHMHHGAHAKKTPVDHAAHERHINHNNMKMD